MKNPEATKFRDFSYYEQGIYGIASGKCGFTSLRNYASLVAFINVKFSSSLSVLLASLSERDLVSLGLVVIPKTANPDHMRNNAELDFAINDEDMETLKNVEHIQNYDEHSFFPVFGGKLK